MRTESIEDYLKAIYDIQKEMCKVSTNSLSEKLNVAPASVTSMIKKLSLKKLLTHKRYQGVKLTKAGQRIALEVIRHHRLIELYLQEALGVPWDLVHDEAEKWEHVISEDLEERIDKKLGYPISDPHGSPIPKRDGTVIELDSIPLTDLKPGQTGDVAKVSDHDPKLLRYIGDMGLYCRRCSSSGSASGIAPWRCRPGPAARSPDPWAASRRPWRVRSGVSSGSWPCAPRSPT